MHGCDSVSSRTTTAARFLKRSRLLALTGLTCVLVGVPSAASAAPTVVSLTFDDGLESQLQAATMLEQHGMRGTFFVNSGLVGTPPPYPRMTWGDLRGLAAAGHEIGGHTLSHLRLTDLTADQQREQICADRTNLVNQGFAAISFAYPFGSFDATTKSIVKDCGYTSGRKNGGIKSANGSCSNCALAETIPPLDPYATRALDSIVTGTTVATLKSYVEQAEPGGGWVQLTFHSICAGCDGNSIAASELAEFLAWLAPRAAAGTVVKTVGEVNPAPAAVPAAVTPVSQVAPAPTTSPPASVPARPQTFPAKLEVQRAGVRNGKLDVLARITGRATGRVEVRYRSSGRTTRFTAPITNGTIRIDRRLPSSQRRKRTGILTMIYAGNALVRADEVRLRAASGKALLRRDATRIDANRRLTVSGTISERARGVVRIRLGYDAADGSAKFLHYRARIRNGKWSLSETLPADAAKAGGQLSIQFTGYEPRSIRGEQLAKAVTP